MTQFYTGVGSRKTPTEILDFMKSIAVRLSAMGVVLRSGGAVGADRAFESGATLAEIFYARQSTPEAEAIARRFHPVWDRLPEYVRQLHGRNAFQVLGLDLITPSKYLICWTPDGALCHKDRSIKTGGTGTAISIASAYGVPVFNLARSDHWTRLKKFIL